MPLIAIALSTPLSASAAQGPSIDTLLAEGHELSHGYDYEGALELAEAALAIDPLHLGAHELLRSMHLRLDSRQGLEARYRDLVARFPESAAAYYLLARNTRSGEMAETYLKLALRLQPDFGPAASMLASRMRGSDERNAALQLAAQAVAAMPGDYGAVSTYVSLLRRQGNGNEAIAFLKTMAARYPDELRFWTELWRLQWREMGRDRDFERLRPQIAAQRHRFMGSLEHMEMLASLLEYAGADDSMEAVELWQSIAERYPDHPRAELALLRAVNATRDIAVKLDVLRTLDELYPGSAVRYAAYSDIIHRLIYDERFEEAIELSQSLLTLPDPGYDAGGVGRDPRVSGMPVLGKSLECIGHAGWFAAAQASGPGERGSRLDWSGRTTYELSLDAEITVVPAAATAARSLAASSCDAANVLATVGLTMAMSGSFRTLGIELLEHAIEIHRNTPENDESSNMGMLARGLELYSELLPYLYLREGRTEDAVRSVDRLYARNQRRTSRFHRIAGEIYETVGRLQDAKRAYFRALPGGRDAEFVRAALDRIYRAADTEIAVFGAEDAPRIPVQATRVTRLHLSVEAPLRRFLDADVNLLLLWSPYLDSHRGYAAAFDRLHSSLGTDLVGSLSVAVGSSPSSSFRVVRRSSSGPQVEPDVAVASSTVMQWGIDELPMALLIDAEGRVLARQMHHGVAVDDWIAGWRALIREALGVPR